MTPEQKFRELWEAAGNCWHEHDDWNEDECIHCGYAFQRPDYEPYDCTDDNPTLTLDCLFEIAGKFGMTRLNFEYQDGVKHAHVWSDRVNNNMAGCEADKTYELALLEALWMAYKGDE